MKLALTILLHGPQSTGKSLTAKALASYLERPIYSIDPTNFIKSPCDIDAEFAAHFHLATKWNAIILIQDVDQRFSELQGSDTTSANCAFFLRGLAQHKGIVILTAREEVEVSSQIQKHVNLTLGYKCWGIWDNDQVWSLQFDRYKAGYLVEFSNEAENHIREFAREEIQKGHSWNGRDIENYIHVAIAMMRLRSTTDDEEEEQTVKLEDVLVAESTMRSYD